MPTDKQRLDWLQSQLEREEYTGRCRFRWSSIGNGWRLHETSREDASRSVREAIDRAIQEADHA